MEKRRKAAQLLLDFYKGRITNNEFEENWPIEKHDPVLSELLPPVWMLYSDYREHRIDPALRKDYRLAKEFHRYLKFLSSTLEYEWIGVPGTWVSKVAEVFDTRRRQTNSSGDIEVWPFYRKEDYRHAWKQSQS
ncbi:MAG TPA: hypothetical protein VMS96_15745 [Terriglobales bacterium]|nr:hypothetical protein [Terriglobales bacterium]